MAGELKGIANELFQALDARDSEKLISNTEADAQSVDENSRRWLRGRDELESYLGEMFEMVTDVHTTLRDVTEHIWDDTGVLTCWLEQRYTLEGSPQQISAPTTIIFRRRDGAWRLALFHSVPLTDHDVSDPGITL
jgi:ketosteroid isomerase-like protein